jgi:AraC family transcriptional regulator
MPPHSLATARNLQRAEPWGSSPEVDAARQRVQQERAWRCPAASEASAPEANVLASRWLDPRTSYRRAEAVSPSDRHLVSLALRTTRLKFTKGSCTVYDGIMPAGTLHVTGPSQRLVAEFQAPCDFIHFQVSNDYLRTCQDAALSDGSRPARDLADLSVRDPLAEQLGRTLIEGGNAGDRLYAESVGQTLVIRLVGLQLPQTRISALPKWRLKRVQDHVDAHIDETLGLADLAAAAGLSRMHFAAQFRAATGYRPHEYLLDQRIERAKAILSAEDMPLAEVALSVGFQGQAHFSTVFKRLAGETPARWRRAMRVGPCDLESGRAGPKDAGGIGEKAGSNVEWTRALRG